MPDTMREEQRISGENVKPSGNPDEMVRIFLRAYHARRAGRSVVYGQSRQIEV